MHGMTKIVEATKAYWAGRNKTTMTQKKKKMKAKHKIIIYPLDAAKSVKPRSMRGIKAIIFLSIFLCICMHVKASASQEIFYKNNHAIDY